MIELILVAIRGLALVTNNPALGGGSSVRMQEASELLGLLGELLERGDEAHDDLVAFTEVMEGMAKQGRAPSTAEWDTLRNRSDAAHDVIQAAAAEVEEEEKRQAIADEIAALEAIDDDERTEEQWNRLDELTAPPEPESETE